MKDEIEEYSIVSRIIKEMIEGYNTDTETFKMLVERGIKLADNIIFQSQRGREKVNK